MRSLYWNFCCEAIHFLAYKSIVCQIKSFRSELVGMYVCICRILFARILLSRICLVTQHSNNLYDWRKNGSIDRIWKSKFWIVIFWIISLVFIVLFGFILLALTNWRIPSAFGFNLERSFFVWTSPRDMRNLGTVLIRSKT